MHSNKIWLRVPRGTLAIIYPITTTIQYYRTVLIPGFQLSSGGSPRIPNPTENHPKHTQNKKCIKFTPPPDMWSPQPSEHRVWSSH